MRVCIWRATLVLLAVAVAAAVAGPQSVGIQVDNKALFTAGVGVLLAGLAFHAGRQSVYNEQNGGNRPGGGSFGGFFPFRRRRHAASNKLDPRVEKIFEAALENDPAGCVLQLTCAVGSIPSAALTGRVKDLHTILSQSSSSAGGKATQDGVVEYQAAMSLGQEGGDCDQLFPRCLAASSVLVDQFQTMKITEYYP